MNNHKQTILVTGANGQLGNELRTVAGLYGHNYDFLFATKESLPVDGAGTVKKYFDQHEINFCINCAAYTAVDKAETEKEKAFAVNATAAGELSAVCNRHGTKLIHISTDYVFDGVTGHPYKETDTPHPINIYGASKLKGEELVLQNNPASIIIRTSWLYASSGNNFVNTMLRLMKEKEKINVVNDQFGSATYANDLAEAIMVVVETMGSEQWAVGSGQRAVDSGQWAVGSGQWAVGSGQRAVGSGQRSVFNYCNGGVISWYEFAMAIKEITVSKCIVNPIPTSAYPTPAKRPQYTVLDTTLIRETFPIIIPGWRESLEKCLSR